MPFCWPRVCLANLDTAFGIIPPFPFHVTLLPHTLPSHVCMHDNVADGTCAVCDSIHIATYVCNCAHQTVLAGNFPDIQSCACTDFNGEQWDSPLGGLLPLHVLPGRWWVG